MISNSFMVTISHSDSRLRLNCVGILYYSFAALEVNILTNIYCWCTNQYSIQRVQSYAVYVSGDRWQGPDWRDHRGFDRERIPNRNRFARPKLIRPRSRVAPHRDPDRDHGPDVPRPNVRVRIQKITKKHFKNIMKKEHSQSWILFEERRLQRHWLIIIVLLIMIITLVAISPLLT